MTSVDERLSALALVLPPSLSPPPGVVLPISIASSPGPGCDMVNSAVGFGKQASVINGFSDLILDPFGPETGAHARSAVGMAELPFNAAVEIEGEVEVQA